MRYIVEVTHTDHRTGTLPQSMSLKAEQFIKDFHLMGRVRAALVNF